ARLQEMTPMARVIQIRRHLGTETEVLRVAIRRCRLSIRGIRAITAILSLSLAVILRASDWPQWRGTHRDGVWPETGIAQAFPPEGPKVQWRVPVGTGFSSPVVAHGSVYVTDSRVTRTNAHENVRCLDAATGKAIWIHLD